LWITDLPGIDLSAHREQIIGLSGTPGSFFGNEVSAYQEQALSPSH
jgi:hypothetical protein